MRKWIIGVSLVLMCLIPVSSAFALDTLTPYVFLDGKKMVFKDQKPIIVQGRSLVPLRVIFEALGAKIKWDDLTKTVTATKDQTIITYKIGELIGKRNNELINIPVSGQLIQGTTLIPLRFVSEALGCIVSWDENSRTISISSKTKTLVDVTNILDGNIVEIKGGENTDKLVLIGFDQLDGGQAAAATDWLAGQLTNAKIWIEPDVQQRNKQGYLLAYVYKEDGTMLNSQIFAKGFAKVSMEAANQRWNELLSYVQNGAKNAKVGLWSTPTQS